MKNSWFSIFANQILGAGLLVFFVTAVSLSSHLQNNAKLAFFWVISIILVIISFGIFLNFIFLVIAVIKKDNYYLEEGSQISKAQSDLLYIPLVGIWLAKNSRTIKKAKEILIEKRARNLFAKAIRSAKEGETFDAIKNILLAKRYSDHNDSPESLWKIRFGQVVEAIDEWQINTEVFLSKRLLCEASLSAFKKDNELWQSFLLTSFREDNKSRQSFSEEVTVCIPEIKLEGIAGISAEALGELSNNLTSLQSERNYVEFARKCVNTGEYAAALKVLRGVFDIGDYDYQNEIENDFLFT